MPNRSAPQGEVRQSLEWKARTGRSASLTKILSFHKGASAYSAIGSVRGLTFSYAA